MANALISTQLNFIVELNVFFFLLVRNEKLVKEKLEIEKQLETFQREVKHVSKANTAKEIRVLKKVVQNLEVGSGIVTFLGYRYCVWLTKPHFHSAFPQSDLMKEKSKFQRTINKKNEEHRNLLEDVSLRVQSLQN